MLTPLQKALREMAGGVRAIANNGKMCASFYELVVEHGRPFERQPRPKRYRKGIPKHCYVNASQLVFEHPRSLIYVEGFILVSEVIPLPIQHAWCVHVKDPHLVIDVTVDHAGAYVGIPFKTSYLKEQWAQEDRYSASLIDSPEDGFPLMQMTKDELAEVVYTVTTGGETNGKAR